MNTCDTSQFLLSKGRVEAGDTVEGDPGLQLQVELEGVPDTF